MISGIRQVSTPPASMKSASPSRIMRAARPNGVMARGAGPLGARRWGRVKPSSIPALPAGRWAQTLGKPDKGALPLEGGPLWPAINSFPGGLGGKGRSRNPGPRGPKPGTQEQGPGSRGGPGEIFSQSHWAQNPGGLESPRGPPRPGERQTFPPYGGAGGKKGTL